MFDSASVVFAHIALNKMAECAVGALRQEDRHALKHIEDLCDSVERSDEIDSIRSITRLIEEQYLTKRSSQCSSLQFC